MSTPYEHQPLAQPWSAHGQQSWPAQPPQSLPPEQYWQPMPPVSKPSNGLAITALVVACLAMLMVLGLFIAVAFAGFFASAGDLEGTAPQVVSGQSYPGELLAAEVTRVISGDFADVVSMTCSRTTAVRVDAVTACHGEVDGFESQVTVTFEDDLGHFTLVEN